MKRFLLPGIAMLLILSGVRCNVEESTMEEPIVEKPAAGESDAEKILREIDDTYQELGYTEKPAKYIALSFDDGPSAVTETLLAVLAEHRVKATFFLIGRNIRANQSKARAIFDGGHELGSHSDGYDSLGGTTAETVIRPSLEKTSSALKEITGKDPVFFRAPNVNYGTSLSAVCAELGLAIIGVSCWSQDWQESVTTEQLVANVLKDAGDGAIINCHELAKTAAGLPAMITGLRAAGYWILPVGRLGAIKGKTLEAGIRYDRIQ
jgi:peptidoglycan/xylan/chitin deacetylase (PgdA/CDA1 family)